MINFMRNNIYMYFPVAYLLDGVKLVGFIERSFLDGFEWDLEYSVRLVYLFDFRHIQKFTKK